MSRKKELNIDKIMHQSNLTISIEFTAQNRKAVFDICPLLAHLC